MYHRCRSEKTAPSSTWWLFVSRRGMQPCQARRRAPGSRVPEWEACAMPPRMARVILGCLKPKPSSAGSRSAVSPRRDATPDAVRGCRRFGTGSTDVTRSVEFIKAHQIRAPFGPAAKLTCPPFHEIDDCEGPACQWPMALRAASDRNDDLDFAMGPSDGRRIERHRAG